MTTDQTPAQRMAEIEHAATSADAPTWSLNTWMLQSQWLIDRCRKLECCLSAIITDYESVDMRSLIAGARAVLGDDDAD